MIVPFAKGQQAQQAPAQAKPSETDMLMALATMHQMGRIQVAGDVIDKSKEFSATQQSNRFNNSGGFRPGTPSAPVLPIKPEDKG